jgi:hypothetical protein
MFSSDAKILATFRSGYMGPSHLGRTGVFSCVPRLPGWSFLRLICEGNLPPPPFPSLALGAGASPTDKS